MWFINNASEISLYLTEGTTCPSQILTFNAVYLNNHFLLREPYWHLKHVFICILYFTLKFYIETKY